MTNPTIQSSTPAPKCGIQRLSSFSRIAFIGMLVLSFAFSIAIRISGYMDFDNSFYNNDFSFLFIVNVISLCMAVIVFLFFNQFKEITFIHPILYKISKILFYIIILRAAFALLVFLRTALSILEIGGDSFQSSGSSFLLFLGISLTAVFFGGALLPLIGSFKTHKRLSIATGVLGIFIMFFAFYFFVNNQSDFFSSSYPYYILNPNNIKIFILFNIILSILLAWFFGEFWGAYKDFDTNDFEEEFATIEKQKVEMKKLKAMDKQIKEENLLNIKAQEKAEKEKLGAIERQKAEQSEKEYHVNHAAESILDLVAKIYLIFGWVLGICALAIGIVLEVEFAFDLEAIGVLLGLLVGAIIVCFHYLVWACLKVILNISNNLFNINSKLSDKKE